MKTPSALSLLLFVCLALSSAAAEQRDSATGKPWRALPLITDGRVDSAWAQVGWGGFVVDDGALRTECDERGMGLLLYKAEKFGNCQLRVVYRCEKPKSNAGVYVRLDDGIIGRIGEQSPAVQRDARGKLSREMIQRLEEASEKHLGAWYPVHHGYEVQIMDATDAFHRTGAIYSLAKAAPVPEKPQTEWRTMIITLEGERISVEVDGKRLSAFDAAADFPPRQHWTEPLREIKRPTIGYLGLQNHDPGDVVWFKEVSVRSLAGRPAHPVKETVIYKQTDGCEIKADVFHDGTTTPRPAVVWIHGGALINGHRESIPASVREFAAGNGYVLVSIDYRLAPVTPLPAIVSDIEDAFRWLREDGAKRFGIAPQRIAVAGGSAGGFLTLIAGFRVQPAPRVLLSFWGYGEVLSDWATKPSPHPRHNERQIRADEVAKQLGGPPVSDSRQRQGDGSMIYLHGRQTGGWARMITGFDPQRAPEKIIPFLPLKNVNPKYPPTVLLHGTADTDVPVEQSQLMAREFEKHGVPFQFHQITNGEHGLGGGDPRQIQEAHQKAFEFMKRHLEPP